MGIVIHGDNLFSKAELITKTNEDDARSKAYNLVSDAVLAAARAGLHRCVVQITADDEILSWLDAKLSNEGFKCVSRMYGSDINSHEYFVSWPSAVPATGGGEPTKQ